MAKDFHTTLGKRTHPSLRDGPSPDPNGPTPPWWCRGPTTDPALAPVRTGMFWGQPGRSSRSLRSSPTRAAIAEADVFTVVGSHDEHVCGPIDHVGT